MRLIDADALIEFIDPGHLRHPDELAFSELDVVNMLNHAPTAYDVDKVVKQLDEKSFFVATSKEFYDNPQDGKNVSDVIEISDAIEIVKGGGVEK